jgi:putative salt-induced outer membrane protein YdiY
MLRKNTRKNLTTLALSATMGLLTAHAGTEASVGKNPKNPIGDGTGSGAASPWEVTAAAGLSLAKGNSDALNFNASILASYIEAANELYLGADYIYAENDGLRTNNSVHAYAQYNRLLSDRAYLGLVSDFWHDESADLDFRFSLAPTFGYYVVKNDTASLAFEAGGGYTWEDQGGLASDYFSLRFAEKFTYKLSDTIKLYQSVIYSPEAEDFNSYLLTAEAGIAAKVTSRFGVRVGVRNQFDSTPAAGREDNDFQLVTSLTYSLGGIADDAPAERRTLKKKKAAPAAAKSGWERTAGLGFSFTDGNSDTLSLAADFATAYYGDPSEFFFNIGGAYGEVEGNRTLQNLRSHIQYNYLFSPMVYGGVQTSYRYDEVAGLDYEVAPAAVIGFYAVKSDTTKLSFETGPSYVFRSNDDGTDEYFALYAGEKFTCQVTDSFSVFQSLAYRIDPSDTDKWTLTATAGFDLDLNSDISLRTQVIDTYDNQPGAGRDENDVLLTSGIAVSF